MLRAGPVQKDKRASRAGKEVRVYEVLVRAGALGKRWVLKRSLTIERNAPGLRKFETTDEKQSFLMLYRAKRHHREADATWSERDSCSSNMTPRFLATLVGVRGDFDVDSAMERLIGGDDWTTERSTIL